MKMQRKDTGSSAQHGHHIQDRSSRRQSLPWDCQVKSLFLSYLKMCLDSPHMFSSEVSSGNGSGCTHCWHICFLAPLFWRLTFSTWQAEGSGSSSLWHLPGSEVLWWELAHMSPHLSSKHVHLINTLLMKILFVSWSIPMTPLENVLFLTCI